MLLDDAGNQHELIGEEAFKKPHFFELVGVDGHHPSVTAEPHGCEVFA